MDDELSRERESAFDALARARREYLPLSAAAALVRLTPDRVLVHTGDAWEQFGDDWLAAKWDSLPRQMSVLTPLGPVEVVIRDSREASLNAVHANAVRRYRDEGLTDWLEALPRDWLRTDAGVIRLATHLADLDRLIEGSELSYDLYQRL